MCTLHNRVISYDTKNNCRNTGKNYFEEGYGEIDHQLRYSHKQIPDVLAQNLMLLNRIAGSSDEMASLINVLNKSIEDVKIEYEDKLKEKDKEIENLKKIIGKK
ncbi:hypothetical protein AAIB48_08105 [Paraclostridium benzoelyticum]|uniref:hypothetical protein n=1 Tax=Paraclostridium benzoelyticum TaxID=1629550 RepID=UPI0031CD041A